jgi:hypothetical protein
MNRQRYYAEHGCGAASRDPEIFYGYCHDTGQMRMMNYADFMGNLQTGYSNLYNNPASAMMPMVNSLSAMMQRGATHQHGHHGHHHHKHQLECGCGCGCREDDCGCDCCISCADVVQYARCGEIRRIPLVFDNDTRRERDVTLQLGNFATEGGLDVGWKTGISPKEFKLAPCGHTTVVLSVEVDCSKLIVAPHEPDQRSSDLESCKVAYATLRAEGCTICPLVIAVAVLPERCEAHHMNCLCGCCN